MSRKVERQVDVWDGFAPTSARWLARFEFNTPGPFTILLRPWLCCGGKGVMARGNHGREICADDQDRKLWLEALAEGCEKTGWRIHPWVMMRNHYHLLLETPEAPNWRSSYWPGG
jgi:hypothetical protein